MPFIKGIIQDCQFKKGYTPHNKGKVGWMTHSLEAKEKLRQSHLGKRNSPNTEFKKGHEGLKGATNGHWKGGVTQLKKSIRQQINYKDWIKAVFDRDNYTCQICETTKEYFHADHYPKSFIKILQENNVTNLDEAINCLALWDVDNGRTLCQSCHYLVTYRRPMPYEGMLFGINRKHLN